MKSQISSKNQKQNNFFSKIWFLFSPLLIFHIREDSMRPFLNPGDTILVNKFAYILKHPKIYDVIVVKNPEKKPSPKYVVKRIKHVRSDNVYLLGDNKSISKDSRVYGWVEQKMIVGKMIAKI